MKSVIVAIQPYYVFLIIAHIMGWDIPQKKTEEVRKDFPKDSAWNKTAHIYCSKNIKSFNRIPAKYQPLMQRFLGKVIGEFVCDSIRKGRANNEGQAYCHNNPNETCLTDNELVSYANIGKPLYFWHISDLTVYETPKELGEFRKPCRFEKSDFICPMLCPYYEYEGPDSARCTNHMTKPPQSWSYVEGL